NGNRRSNPIVFDPARAVDATGNQHLDSGKCQPVHGRAKQHALVFDGGQPGSAVACDHAVDFLYSSDATLTFWRMTHDVIPHSTQHQAPLRILVSLPPRWLSERAWRDSGLQP